MKTLLARFREPSTYAGLAAILMLSGLSSDTANAIAEAVGALCGLLAVLLPERR